MFLHADFYSGCLRRTVSFDAVLPADAPEGPGPGEPFQTLYLLHGYCGSCGDWLFHTRIRELAESRRMAVILPSGENSFYVDCENGAQYGEFTGRELVAFTRRIFPLSEKREDTLIGGLSMGGYGALRNGLKYSDTFGSVIALSAALITDAVAANGGDMPGAPEPKEYYRSVFGDPARLLGSDKDPRALAKKRKEEGGPLPAVYMACGTEDSLLQPSRSMRDCLRDIGVPVTYEEGPGVHDWNFWNTYIARALDWYFRKEP